MLLSRRKERVFLLVSAMGAGLGVICPAQADQQVLTAAVDVWIREAAPDATYENDLISVWSSRSSDGARRYGLVEFDVSGLSGQTLQFVALELYSRTGGSQASLPLRQQAFVIASGGRSPGSTTWNTYVAEYEGGKQPLEGLGRYDLPAVNSSPGLQNAYVSSAASPADISLLQSVIDAGGPLRLVLAADEGADYRRDWGDASASQPVRLVVQASATSPACRLTREPLPAARQAAAYSASLLETQICDPPVTVEISDCMLPPGLSLDPVTGAVTGTAHYAGRFPFSARLRDASGGVTEELQFELAVTAVYNTRADLDTDGDVDLLDLDRLAGAFSGPRPAPAACEPGAVPTDSVVLEATGDVWIRELLPDQTYESDLVSVWSSTTSSEDRGYRRYGLVEFDVGSLAGRQLGAITLSMWVADAFSGTQYPVKQSAFVIPSDGTPLTSLTWSSYLAQKDASKQALQTLGRYEEAAPVTAGTMGTYRDSIASMSDLAAVAGEAAGDGRLSLVFVADEDGSDYRGDWGDASNAAGAGYREKPALLKVLFGSPCRISTTTLPDGRIGQPYTAQLAASSECSQPVRWRVVDCELPPGLELNIDSGQITGTPQFGGDYPFRVRLFDVTTSTVRDANLSLHVASAAEDLDQDGDVDRDDYAAVAASFTGPLEPDAELCWRTYVQRCLERLIAYGTDRYGSLQTPMLMSIVDVGTLTSPEFPPLLDADLRTEGRPRHGRRSPGGSNFWMDQVTLRTMYRLTEVTGNPAYAEAADDYISAVFQYAVNTTTEREGTLVWGSHSYYHAFADAPAGDAYGTGSPVHEILITHPEWHRMYALDPAGTRAEVDMIWTWHVHDKVNGRHNRHDDGNPGLDFAYSGGSFSLAFASLYAETGESRYMDRAKLLVDWHWRHRNQATGLVPDAPSAGTRYDGTHCFTSVTGPYASQLLRCYEVTGDTLFRDRAVSYIKSYDRYAWDDAAQTYYGMVRLDGRPVVGEYGASGYDIWAPSGPVDVWRTTMFSYEFPLIAAQAALYAYELSSGDPAARDPELLQIALRWAGVIERALPARPGRRWKTELEAALPRVLETGGTYAENYGRAISFYVNLYHATSDAQYLTIGRTLAREAVQKLYVNGMFRGHPAKDYYQSNDGVGFLLHALMQLDALPGRWRLAF